MFRRSCLCVFMLLDWVRGLVLWLLFLLVLFRVPQFRHDLPGVAVGVKMVGVDTSFLLGPLLAGMARKHVLVEVEVVFFVLIEMHLRHFVSSFLCFTLGKINCAVTFVCKYLLIRFVFVAEK